MYLFNSHHNFFSSLALIFLKRIVTFLNLLNRVLGVLECWRALRASVLRCLCAWRDSMLTCLRAYVITCFCAWRACVLGKFTCSAYLRAYVLGVLACVHACVLVTMKPFIFLRVCALGVLFCLICFTFQYLNLKILRAKKLCALSSWTYFLFTFWYQLIKLYKTNLRVAGKSINLS